MTTLRAGACPNCGAPIEFRWSSAVQTVCAHCRSVVVRHDVDLEALGEVGDLPPDSSPIQIGTEGRSSDRRLHGRPAASSTSTRTAAGTSGTSCLPTARAAGCRTPRPSTPSPSWWQPAGRAARGRPRRRSGRPFAFDGRVLHGHDAHQGALPGRRRRAALRVLGQGRRAVRRPARRTTAIRDARLQRVAAAAVHRRVRRVRRPGAAQPQDLRQRLTARRRRPRIQLPATAARPSSCARSPHASRWRAPAAARFRTRTTPTSSSCRRRSTRAIVPKIPLGTRGTWRGHQFEVIGFQHRSIVVEDERLRLERVRAVQSRTRAFAISASTRGTGTTSAVHALPAVAGAGRGRGHVPRRGPSGSSRPRRRRTDFVLGEFPWRVRVGDVVDVSDYVAPPLMLSSEGTDERDHLVARRVHRPARRSGRRSSCRATRPSRSACSRTSRRPSRQEPRVTWRTFVALALALLVAAGLAAALTARARAGVRSRLRVSAERDRRSRRSSPSRFTMTRRGHDRARDRDATSNNWLGLRLRADQQRHRRRLRLRPRGQLLLRHRQRRTWTEGVTQRDSVVCPRVPAGAYYLRVEPEGDRRARRPVLAQGPARRARRSGPT